MNVGRENVDNGNNGHSMEMEYNLAENSSDMFENGMGSNDALIPNKTFNSP